MDTSQDEENLKDGEHIDDSQNDKVDDKKQEGRSREIQG